MIRANKNNIPVIVSMEIKIMDTELEQKIYRILIDNLPNDHNFTDVVNNLLALVERGCN